METPVTWTQLIIAVIFILVTTLSPQFYQLYKARQEGAEKKRQQDLEERQQDIEEKKMETQSWQTVIGEYQRQIESLRRLEEENAQLRPLAIKNAVLEQKCRQAHDDKEDWKARAVELEAVLINSNIIPPPFKRLPRVDDTDEIKTISKKMKAIKQDSQPSATTDSPTLVFPKEEVDSANRN